MDETSSKNVLSGFASHLAESKLLEKSAALTALQQAIQSKIPYIDFLVQQKLLDEVVVARSVSEYFGFPFCDVQAFDRELIPKEFLTLQLTRQRSALPLFKKNGLIYLAITDPTVEHLYDIRFLTGLDIRLFIVEASKLTQVIDELLNSLILSEIKSFSEDVQNISVSAYKDDSTDLTTYDAESAPVINYVNKVLLDAIERGASDIHFEHFEDNYRIRFRQHGVLFQIPSPPLKLANYILARIKIMSNLDITEHRVPQDGRFKLIISKKKAIDFRVSVCPAIFGEKIVLRILDPASVNQGINDLGMEPEQLAYFADALEHSQGLILVTGPTGSGKTVTLYSALHALNSIEKNISTVEDPVEIPMQGINQVNVNLKTGLTFPTALRSFLRQDPDIIMVGEIRDVETAEIGVKASQTGHLVLSTLHTNSAPESVTRLMNMGVAPYNLATSLMLVIAQRLIRVLCDFCKIADTLPSETLLKEGFSQEEIPSLQLYKAVGCERCASGFKGRTAIFEVMPITPPLATIIMEGANTLTIIEQAQKEGFINLRQAGLLKVKRGITSLAELNRVFK